MVYNRNTCVRALRVWISVTRFNKAIMINEMGYRMTMKSVFKGWSRSLYRRKGLVLLHYVILDGELRRGWYRFVRGLAKLPAPRSARNEMLGQFLANKMARSRAWKVWLVWRWAIRLRISTRFNPRRPMQNIDDSPRPPSPQTLAMPQTMSALKALRSFQRGCLGDSDNGEVVNKMKETVEELSVIREELSALMNRSSTSSMSSDAIILDKTQENCNAILQRVSRRHRQTGDEISNTDAFLEREMQLYRELSTSPPTFG